MKHSHYYNDTSTEHIIKLLPLFINWSPKNTQITTYILICHCTSLSPWFIILDKNNFVNVPHHYLTAGGYQVCL